jgi:hypothetical protein
MSYNRRNGDRSKGNRNKRDKNKLKMGTGFGNGIDI